MALDHVGIHTKNFEESVTFFEKVLIPLGNKRKMDISNEHGRATGFGKYGPAFWVHGPPEGTAATESPSGSLHIAFAASSRAEVDAFYSAAIAAGATCNGPPGLRFKYHPFYYGAFVIKDGNNIEAVNHFEFFSWKLWLPIAVAVAAAWWMLK